jgi:hypothetical protein
MFRLRERFTARRRQKAQRRHLLERERQQGLAGQDTEQAIRDAARGSASAQQGMYGQN